MADSMAARGPDGAGLWCKDWVCLAHRRLSVIDLSEAGAQPMVDEELGLTISFNGCIYNHNQLREELRSHYRFSSTSDTEVIIKAYAHWGEHFVDHLVGMFAIALYDQRRNRVILARDRLGIKPLYLSRQSKRLRFASTVPALLAGGAVDTSLDPVALHHYLSWHSIVPAPRTILQGVEKLPAATVRIIESDGTERDRIFWTAQYSRDAERSTWSEDDWMDAIHESLRTAVERRLVADVPVGVLLSGGLDSSLLVGLLAEAGQSHVKTFSIGFDDAGGQSGDEFEFSDIVAKQFGTDHHRLHIDNAELAPAVRRAVAAMTEPMASHDVTAFYLLSEAVSQHVKVVQSGQGADEVFAGYDYHRAAASVPRTSAVDAFTESFVDRRHQDVLDLLDPALAPSTDVSREALERNLGAEGADSTLDALLRLDTHSLMIDDPVKRVDSMTMAFGLEARVPFLDQDLVSLAAQCPPELKLRDEGKGPLKALGREILPREVVDRPKGYFPVPQLCHLDGEVLDMVREVMLAPEARDRGVFRSDRVDALLDDPNGSLTPTGTNTLWSLAVLEMWLQNNDVGK
ncbi:asparagine synthase (glutamine-hydrolyzing) [Okibacterium sp. HSC-33S16]|nr:asparagine synthase (glutamine-hydrolyzing) [Okibacterium sp. HSC-33S16]